MPGIDRSTLRGELDAHYRASVDDALRAAGVRALPGGFLPRLPPSIRESILDCAALEGALPAPLVEHYLVKSPRMVIEQHLAPRLRVLDEPLSSAPSLLTALARAQEILKSAHTPTPRGGPDKDALLRVDHSAPALTPALLVPSYLLSCGLPLLGLYPAERAALARLDLPPAETLDTWLSGRLAHEIFHGPLRERDTPPPPWLVQEAAALALNARAFPRHVFPDRVGEAIPGVSLLVLVGQGLARALGWRTLFSALTEPDQFAARAGPITATALAVVGHQDWLARRTPPFARDALDADAQVKLAHLARSLDEARTVDPRARALTDALSRAHELGALAGARSVPKLVTLARDLPWEALPWFEAPPDDDDARLLADGVTALFQENALDAALGGLFVTRPAPLPRDAFTLDAVACRLEARRRPSGVFGEPASWIAPPPLCRMLRARGAERVLVTGALRENRERLARELLALAHGGIGLPREVRLEGTDGRV